VGIFWEGGERRIDEKGKSKFKTYITYLSFHQQINK
jgi:hypothetical protein